MYKLLALIGFLFFINLTSVYGTDTLALKTVVSDTIRENVNQPVEQILDNANGMVDLSISTGFSLESFLRGILGIAVLILIAFVFSENRKAISWKVIIIGLAIQILLAIGVLQVHFIQMFFEFVGHLFVKVLDFTRIGTDFLFGGFLDTSTYGYIFAFQILPTIIFFSALTSVLFYLGIIQKIVWGLAWLMTKAMKLSGAESLSVAGNIFLGQTEAPLMIKAYLPKMNNSEMFLVMVGGMATVAGGVLAGEAVGEGCVLDERALVEEQGQPLAAEQLPVSARLLVVLRIAALSDALELLPGLSFGFHVRPPARSRAPRTARYTRPGRGRRSTSLSSQLLASTSASSDTPV
jgi:CNT family concentrative nucleoside transporter